MAVPRGNYGGGGGPFHHLVQVRLISGLVYKSIGGGEGLWLLIKRGVIVYTMCYLVIDQSIFQDRRGRHQINTLWFRVNKVKNTFFFLKISIFFVK